MPLLRVEDLGHRFHNGVWGFRHVSFIMESGEFLVLTGRNGSGKTVLVKHLNALLKATEGTVFLDDVPVGKNLTETRRRIGFVFQNPYAQATQETVEADAAFGPENLGLSEEATQERVRIALSKTGLSGMEERHTATLSGGEMKRLAIAGVIAMNPDLLIFDEPFSGLDYPGMKQCIGILEELKKEGKSLIIVTHHYEKVLRLTDRILIMNGGNLAENGRPTEVLSRAERYGVAEPGVEW